MLSSAYSISVNPKRGLVRQGICLNGYTAGEPLTAQGPAFNGMCVRVYLAAGAMRCCEEYVPYKFQSSPS